MIFIYSEIRRDFDEDFEPFLNFPPAFTGFCKSCRGVLVIEILEREDAFSTGLGCMKPLVLAP